jgi:hypothetical protein
MSTFVKFLKNPMFQAVLIGAFGGVTPKLIEMIPKLFSNIYPSTGQLLGLTLLALIGGVIVFIYKEKNFQKALILGAGAQAILATLTANAVAPNQTGLLFPPDISIVSRAYAQPVDTAATIRLVFVQNQSPCRLNALWLRADTGTIQHYTVEGDTIIVAVSLSAKELRVDLPPQATGIVFSVEELMKSKCFRLRIKSRQMVKDFWETFGSVQTPAYTIEKSE